MEEIISHLLSLSAKKETVFVAIDGMQGGGKTTLLRHIQKRVSNIKVISMDDFFTPSQQNDDHARVKRDVITPLKDNKTAIFKIYDWMQNKIVDAKPISPGGIIVVEGIYSMEKELIDAYDYKIWVDCPEDIGLKRGITRDKGANEKLWVEKWIPETIRYIEEQKPYEKADVVISYKDISELSA